jgi:hypothetical protein
VKDQNTDSELGNQDYPADSNAGVSGRGSAEVSSSFMVQATES